MFGYKIREIANLYNNAFVVCENNNHGVLTLSELMKIYPVSQIYFGRSTGNPQDEIPTLMQAGFKTTVTSKPLVIGRLRKAVAGSLIIHSEMLKGEMDNYVEDENGKMDSAEGFLDDRVMAAAVAQMGWNDAAMRSSVKKIQLSTTGGKDPFSFEGMFDESKQGGGFPIAPQHAMH